MPVHWVPLWNQHTGLVKPQHHVNLAVRLAPAPPTAAGRHHEDVLLMTLFRRESAYNQMIRYWPGAGCRMTDFEGEAGHERWDDTVVDDTEGVHGVEYPTRQEIPHLDWQLRYTEPRLKPNTMAGLLGLTLGTVTTVQDGAALAYRHHLTPSASTALPSIGLMTRHAQGAGYRYRGAKSEGFTLESNGAYVRGIVPLIGSGARLPSVDALELLTFAPVIVEPWLRWGDCHLYVKPLTSPLALPSDPLPGASNLGVGAIDLSRYILEMRVETRNALAAASAYRADSHRERQSLHPTRRDTVMHLVLELDDVREAMALAQYESQTPLALEWNCAHTTLIVGGSAWVYGFVLIVPRLQLRSLPRGDRDDFDTLALEGTVLSDRTNPEITAWIFNGQPRYLDPGAP
jgi:hypothetical protein